MINNYQNVGNAQGKYQLDKVYGQAYETHTIEKKWHEKCSKCGW